ncbi:hypothetical protein AMATHDRAFT_144465 [Amanita thiersii Skay4041]|uniref:FYVE-type domain-containing protein n=1 Tax=Amanita thiersii Skay4041 TaxID=703135 RepID=A0A2A9NN11_9AGAR|nr:hypothetical protein AMATHDRAFT_144465 [Amanita thiersii Skay4041]
MSLLAVAVAAIASRPPSASPPSSSPSIPVHPTSSLSSHQNHCPITRHNEHLAVLLPKYLWKPDNLASHCDMFGCPIRFSILERRHHCRKCGGVFCNTCSSHTTRLLDTSSLDFLHPPKGIPISTYDSVTSPVTECRVCDDCWDQIHGYTRTSRPSQSSSSCCLHSSPISVASSPISSGESSLCSSVVATPPTTQTITLMSPPSKTCSIHTASSTSSMEASVQNGALARPKRLSIRHSHLPLPVEIPSERSYGELDAYPLRRSSVLCKATGGGRWEPKPCPVYAGYRLPIPGAKALFEIEMENEEKEERLRRENPVVKDGDFQYRFSKEPEPVIMSSSPYHLATF